jgi:hypothetical protein
MGGKITDEQMKMFRVREGVFQELAQQKLMAQAAIDSGRVPSDEAVRQEIMTLPYFLKDGKFDPMQYKSTLEANRYSPSLFEKMIREQLAVEEWSKSFSNQIRVSDAELKAEFLSSQNQRSYKYVSFPAQAPAAGKDAKQPELTPKAAAEKVAAMLRADKKSDDAVNALVKPFGVAVREISNAPADSGFVAGAEDLPAMSKELFAEEGGLEVGKTKIYESPSRITVVLVTSAKKPDLAKFESMRPELLQSIRSRKERDLMGSVMKKLTEKAKIVTNPSVVSGNAEETG